MADESLSIEISARDLTGQAFADVKRQLESLNQSSAQAAKGVGELSDGAEKLGGKLKGAGVVAAVGLVINELTKFHAETKKAASAIFDQADALGITTDQFQAYAFAADQVGVRQEVMSATLSRFTVKLGEAAGGNKAAIQDFDRLGVKILDSSGRLRDQNTILAEVAQALVKMGTGAEQAAAAKSLLGVSGARLMPLIQLLAQGVGELDRQSKAAGTTISGPTVEAANKLENQSKQTQIAIRAFYAEIGMPIEIKFLKAVESVVGGIADAYKRAQREQTEFTKNAGVRAAQGDVAQLKDQLAAAEQQLATNPNNKMAQASVDALKKRLADANTSETKAQVLRGRDDQYQSELWRLMNDGLPAQGGGEKQPPIAGAGTGGAGGGGGTRDRIQEAINQLAGQRVAAEQALRQMVAGAGLPLKDLEAQVALEKKIADELAKLGKYDPKDPRVAQIREQVIAHETAEAALKKWTAAARDADEVERRSGDGTAYLRGEMQRLNEALDTGRLRYSTYGEAVRIAQEKAADMRLQARGAAGGMDGLLAGMEYAANQWERNNRAFQQGGRMYEKVIADMTTLTTSLGDNFGQTALKMAADWANMFLQMEMRAQMSNIWNLLSGKGATDQGILGSILGSLMGGGGSGITAVGGGFDVSAASAMPGGFMPGFAGGGEPPVNRPFWVGERGPELMQLGTSSRVFNQDQLAGMGGGPTINMPMTVQFGSVVSRAELERHGAMIEERARKGAIAGMMEARRTSSSVRKTFR